MADYSSSVRRILMIAVMAALTAGIIEALSFVSLGVIDRRIPRWRNLQNVRLAIAESEGNTGTAGSGDEIPAEAATGEPSFADDEVSRWMMRINDRQVIHPYIGFVEQRRDDEMARRRQGRNFEAGQYGFPRNTYGIFHEPRPDLVVVVVVGGSFSRQISYGGQRRIEKRLEATDRFQGRDVIVISLGLGGYKQPQQLMAVNYFLALGMHIDILVNIDGFNEVVLPVTENTQFSVNPFFPRAWSFRVGDLDPALMGLRGKIEHYREQRSDLALVFSGAPWRYSMACSLVWRLLDRRTVGLANRAEAELRDRSGIHAGFQALGPEFHAESEDRLAEQLVEVWRRCSVLLQGLAQANGIEYYHFLQPNQYVEGSKRLGSAEREVAINPDSGIQDPVSRGYPLMQGAASDLRESGVAFVDLTEVFSGLDEAVYIDDCCHVNGLGIKLVVERVVETIAVGGLAEDDGRRAGVIQGAGG